MSNNSSECCPMFDPLLWDGKTFNWTDKKFIKDRVLTLFYIPVNFGSVITKMSRKVDKVGGTIPDGLCLAEHTSKWNMNLYLAVDMSVPEAVNTSLSGSFVSKVFEGDYKNVSKWNNDFTAYVKTLNVKLTKQYIWYTTCPKCVVKYGKNYVVFVGQVK